MSQDGLRDRKGIAPSTSAPPPPGLARDLVTWILSVADASSIGPTLRLGGEVGGLRQVDPDRAVRLETEDCREPTREGLARLFCRG